MDVIGYVRVSRVAGREGDRFISPSEQRKAIASWAEANGHRIVAVHEDLDQPGSKVDRPGLVAAMEQVESGQANGIVVAKLDRFGRSVVHQSALLDRLRAADAALFTVAEGIDTRGATGKLIADILAAIAEWELERIRGNWSTARAAAAERGVYLAAPPVGYRKTEAGHLEPDEWAPFIAEAFQRRAQGESWKVICHWLEDQGVPSRSGGGWSVSTLRSLMRSRAFLGEANGRAGQHEPLVSPATWQAANAARGVAPPRSGRSSGLLSGLLRCAGCRYAMKASQGYKGRLEYRCKASRGEVSGGRCEAPASVSAKVIEPYMMDRFWEWVGEYELRGSDKDDDIEAAEAALRAAEAELDAALDRRLADALGGDDSDAYIALVRRRREAVDDARARLANVSGQAAALLPATNLREVWPDLTLYDQRKLLAAAFDCVFVRRGRTRDPIESRIFICGHGDAPELPVRGQRWAVQPFDFPATAEAAGKDSG